MNARETTTTIMVLLMVVIMAAAAHAQGNQRPPDFDSLDTDGDGQVSAEEFSSAPMRGNRSPEEVFKHLDANGDGYITRDEMRPPEGRGGQGGGARASFSDFDTNGDGCISEAEFEEMRTKMREAIQNRRRQGRGGNGS